MRKSLILTGLLFVCLFSPGQLPAFQPVTSRMTESLRQDLTYRAPDDIVQAIVYLRENLDLAAIDRGLALASADKKKRHSEVVGAMLQSAKTTQAPVLELLDQAMNSGDVTAYQPYWILNCIAVTGKVSFLASFSGRDEVEWMTRDQVYTRNRTIKNTTRPLYLPDPDSLRKYSYPIRSLGLEKLWNRGLTGKGVLVCVIDEGMDGKHPLLAPKWRGANGGTAGESWYDPVEGSTFPFDDDRNAPSHGTGVLGLIVAGEKSLGVAYDAQWIGAKVFDNKNLTDDGGPSTKDSYLIAAFQWALDPDGNPETVVDVPDVINNSWGTAGEFQEDICQQKLWMLIDRIEAAGSVLVFSGGNDGPDPWTIGSPGSRAASPVNAFAIGAVDSSGNVCSFSSRGPSACDSVSIKPNICAPGYRVPALVASDRSEIVEFQNGTSYSAPYVSGIIALMRQADPTLTPDEIKGLIVETATDAGLPGPDYALGYGIINPDSIFARLSVPDHPVLFTKRVEADDSQAGNGNGYLEQGEEIILRVPVYNSGSTAAGVTGRIRSSSGGILFLDSTAAYGDIPILGGAVNQDDPFRFSILPDAPAGGQVVFYLDLYSGGALLKTVQVSLTIAPAVEGVALHDNGTFSFGFTNYGQFGGHIGLTGAGAALRYPHGAPYTMLYRGALVIGTSSLRVSDGIADFDFSPAPGGPLKLIEGSPRADQAGVGYLQEKTRGGLNAIGVKIRQTSLVWRNSPDNKYAILEYTVHNPHSAELRSFYIGVYADWDIPDSIPTRDIVRWNGALKTGYMLSPTFPEFGCGGLTLVSDQTVSGHRAIRNSQYIHSGYSDRVAFGFLSGGTNHAATDSLDDWSQLLAAGPLTIPAGDSVKVAWALVLGDDEADLLANAARARDKYSASLALAGSETAAPSAARLPRAFSLAQNYPNPFNPSTTISYRIPESESSVPVRLTVFDLRGRRVIELVNQDQAGGSYSVIWNGRDTEGRPIASGIYFYRLQAAGQSAVRKMVLLK